MLVFFEILNLQFVSLAFILHVMTVMFFFFFFIFSAFGQLGGHFLGFLYRSYCISSATHHPSAFGVPIWPLAAVGGRVRIRWVFWKAKKRCFSRMVPGPRSKGVLWNRQDGISK